MAWIGAWQELLLERIFAAVLFCARINDLSMLALAILPFVMEMIALRAKRRVGQLEARQK